MTEPEKILEIRDLNIRFASGNGILQAVEGLNLDLFRGETLGLVGESGSGKSVAALSLMRLLGPQAQVSGEIRLRNQEGGFTELSKLAEREMNPIRGRRLAMIFQEPMTSLNPVLSCGEQIAEGLRLQQKWSAEEARRQTLDWLRRVQLQDPERVYQSFPHQLSGGQKQRVMIAMALSCNPDVLIADEPTTALDVTVQQTILALMRELRSAWNGAVLFISHDLGVIAEIADRVMVMQKGKVVEEGPVGRLFNHPVHPYTRGLLACRPPLHQRPRRLPTIEDFLEGNGESKTEELVKPHELSQRLSALMAREPLLELDKLRVSFGYGRNLWGKPKAWVHAVDEVSFSLYPGETLGLVGESGCGKTTLGRAILQLVHPQSGSIRFQGEELLPFSPKRRKRLSRDIQMVFQDPYGSLNPRHSVGEAILEPIKVHRLFEKETAQRERAFELIQLVGLQPDHFYRLPHEFSGGQRQRLCIARALALQPRLLICDESVSALDVSIQAQILNLLMDLREQLQLSLLFISHDLSVVKLMSDRIMVMNQGKIEEMGPAEEVYTHPRSDFTRRLIAAIPRGTAIG